MHVNCLRVGYLKLDIKPFPIPFNFFMCDLYFKAVPTLNDA